jgi:hypothetical protein
MSIQVRTRPLRIRRDGAAGPAPPLREAPPWRPACPRRQADRRFRCGCLFELTSSQLEIGRLASCPDDAWVDAPLGRRGRSDCTVFDRPHVRVALQPVSVRPSKTSSPFGRRSPEVRGTNGELPGRRQAFVEQASRWHVNFRRLSRRPGRPGRSTVSADLPRTSLADQYNASLRPSLGGITIFRTLSPGAG